MVLKILRAGTSLKLSLVLAVLFFDYNISANKKTEIDSVKNELAKCKTDTGKFYILHGMFWKYFFNDFKKAKFYGEWAYSLEKNNRDLKILADAWDLKAIIALNEGKKDSAYFLYHKVLEYSKKINYGIRIGWSHRAIAEIHNRNSKFDSAVFNLKLSKLYFKDINDLRQINFQIAIAYQRLGKHDSAIVYYTHSSRGDSILGDKLHEVYTYLNVAKSCVKTNDLKKSVGYLNKALNKADELKNDTLTMAVYIETGNYIHKQKKNYSLAISYYQRALALAETYKHYREASMLNYEIANCYLSENKDSIALKYNLKSLEFARKVKARHYFSDAYYNLGFNYKKLGNDDLALKNFKLCWQTKCEFCPPIAFHGALIEIADIYLKEKNYKLAKDWYDKSLELAENSKAKLEIAESELKIGNYYCLLHQSAFAEKSYNHSLEASQEVSDISFVKTLTDTLTRFYLLQNNCKKAMHFLAISRLLGDSLNNNDKKASISTLEMNFEFERIRNENADKQKKLEQQKTFRNFLLLVSILLTVLGAVIFISYRRKRKDNKLLSLQKNEIEKISHQLHEADEMKLRFFTNISHELRTPLTLIISPLKKLLKATDNENSKNLLSLMLRNTQKLQSLINQLLDISKLDKGELRLNIGQGNLNKLIVVNAAMFQSIAEEKKIEFNVIEKEKNIVFGFDAPRMDQVFNNLLSNAFKFTPEGGKISLEIGTNRMENRNYAEIKLKDNGVGIPPESLDKIFDRFYQSYSTISRNFEGSGIGLSVAKEFVELHGGKILVSSEPGKLTEFTVLLPMINVDAPTETEDIEIEDNDTDQTFTSKEIGKENPQKRKGESLLIVEDNADLRDYLNGFLSEKYEIILACNGKEGIGLAKAKVPDLIISDVMMPETDGYQLTQTIKNNVETSHIPVILLTAKAGHESKIEGLEKGADDYINKPFDEEELLLKIRNILNNRRILQEKYRKQVKVDPSDVQVKSLEEQFLLKLTAIVEKEMSNPELDVDFLSREMGMSRPQLYRKLKALTDLSINHFICSIRLKRAAQLLEKKSATVSEIAFITGFENLSYFTRKFKEEFGTVPSEY